MHTQRTGGMTAIGILNIIFGSIGSLMSLLLILGGGVVAAVGSAGMAAETAEANDAGQLVATGGMLLMGLGLLMLLCNVLLAVSGIGVLKMASWGRMLAMISGGAMALLGVFAMLNGDFGVGTIFMVVYGGMLTGLFLKPEWKAAFSGQASAATMMQPTHATQPDQMRHAA